MTRRMPKVQVAGYTETRTHPWRNEIRVGWPRRCLCIVWEPIRKRAHTQLVRELSVTVVSAFWATMEWSWPKEWNYSGRANLHFKKKKCRRGMNGRTFSRNPRKRRKSHDPSPPPLSVRLSLSTAPHCGPCYHYCSLSSSVPYSATYLAVLFSFIISFSLLFFLSSFFLLSRFCFCFSFFLTDHTGW